MNLESILQILVSGVTLGAIYAISAIGLALLWGVMGMLNLAHGAFMAIGAYASVYAVATLGLPWFLGLPIAFLVGLAVGWLLYQSTVRWIIGSENYETNIVVVTVGVAILIKSLLIIAFTANPTRQPFAIDGGLYLENIFFPYQTAMIIGITLTLMIIVNVVLSKTMMGRAISLDSSFKCNV